VKVEDENVEDVSDLHLALKERRDRDVRVTVVRDRRETALTVPPMPAATEAPAPPAPPTAPTPPTPRAHRPGAQSAMNEQIQRDVERALRDARAAQADAWRALRDKQRAHQDALNGPGRSVEVEVDSDDETVAAEAIERDGDDDAIEDPAGTPAPEAVEVETPSPQDDAAIRRAVQEARRIRIEMQQGPAQ